jgi:4-diphosphocytidyl-2-C-methyl-D-erythritol kinase
LRVSEPLVEKACAKINLTLRVLGRREDGYHELESLVAFADFADKLDLELDQPESLDVSGPFAAACGAGADNLVLKAAAALRERVGRLKSGRFLLDKRIPVAAGIGGGSADAAAALRLLARANDLTLDDPRMESAALAAGADVPVCLESKPRVMRGVGDLLSTPVTLPTLPALLVNPAVPLATRDVFAAFAGSEGSKAQVRTPPRERDAAIDFLSRYGNDLAPAAVRCAPVITDVLLTLRALPGLRLARMSGSGPTCFGLFRSPGEAAAAARRLQAERKEWWVQAAIIG